MTVLSVNLNKIALLRNSRGRDYPRVIDFAKKAINAGAKGITIHPRPDQRHAKYSDIVSLKALCTDHQVELNIEGYPTQELVDLCIENQVDQMTLVPDLPNQITSDHGWIIDDAKSLLVDVLTQLSKAKIRSSLFMDTDVDEIQKAKQVGADRIELHTESYARSFENNTHTKHIESFYNAYRYAKSCGLGVNAGHDLSLDNLPFFLSKLPVEEVSIGHALTIEALNEGFVQVVSEYVKICEG